jgi:hypothetical protein
MTMPFRRHKDLNLLGRPKIGTATSNDNAIQTAQRSEPGLLSHQAADHNAIQTAQRSEQEVGDCISCGHESDVLPEGFINQLQKLCKECQALKNMGWLE